MSSNIGVVIGFLFGLSCILYILVALGRIWLYSKRQAELLKGILAALKKD